MCMKVCLCMGVCVSLGDGGNVGSQGRTGAAMAWGRPRWSSVPVSTNVCRGDDIVEWCSDGCVKVGDIEVWAYYYFYEGENPDLCDWEDRMEIEVEECWI